MRMVLALIATLNVSIVGAQAQESSFGRKTSPAESVVRSSSSSIPANAAIDFAGFVKLTGDLQQIRESRRIPIAKFNEMSRDPQTIILDTRSKQAFDVVHVAGAIHLNFSDFTEEKLRKVIPIKQARILIYCNNNFKEPEADAGEAFVEGTKNKLPQLALNIPTFVNLHGYGYTNVYELADQLELNDSRLKLAGTGITKEQPEPWHEPKRPIGSVGR